MSARRKTSRSRSMKKRLGFGPIIARSQNKKINGERVGQGIEQI
jgi:hypothetical protein